MTYRYELGTADGDDIGSYTTLVSDWEPGDVVSLGDDLCYRTRSPTKPSFGFQRVASTRWPFSLHCKRRRLRKRRSSGS